MDIWMKRRAILATEWDPSGDYGEGMACEECKPKGNWSKGGGGGRKAENKLLKAQ